MLISFLGCFFVSLYKTVPKILCAFLFTYVCMVFIFADTKLKILGLAGFALISSTVNLIALKIEEANKVV
jgi:hypothetical protein